MGKYVELDDEPALKRRKFAMAFVKHGGNVSKAATAASISDSYARTLLKRKDVQSTINRERGRLKRNFNIETNDMLERMFEMLTLDAGDCYDDDGNVLPVPQMPEHVRQALGGKLDRPELPKREKILEMITTHLGMYPNDAARININVGDDVIKALQEGRQRVNQMKQADVIEQDDGDQTS